MGGANMGLLLAGVMGLAVYGIIAGIRMYRRDAKLPGDLAIALEVGSTRTTAVGSGIDRLGMRWAPAILRMMGPKAVNKKRRQIDMAGNPAGLTIDRYAARRAVYGGLGALGAFTMLLRGQVILALVLVAFGLFWVEVGLWSAVRMRRDHIDRTLPDFLDVLAVVVSAGLGFRQALGRVAEKYEGPWADELRITLRQMDMGVSRREAFEQLRKRNDSEQVAMFVTTLQQGEELGAPIVETLIQIANDMRRTDAQNARRKAARAVPKATFAVTTFLLPGTLVLLTVGFVYGANIDFSFLTGG
ncbi:tight adherence protein C [Streptomyces sp. DvalAA-43]|jgi:tight adherence protein C|nr:tight adherence protein C [Streptomyces sp. DvalAA-43]